MIGFWLGVAVLTSIAIAFVFLPFLKALKAPIEAKKRAVDRQQLNIGIFEERLSELDKERESGSLDDENYELLKLELEKNLLIDVEEQAEIPPKRPEKSTLITVTLMALLVPAVSFGLYGELGRLNDLALSKVERPAMPKQEVVSIEDAVSKLEQELAEHPENAEGWYMLSTTYMNMGRFDEGLKGFQKVLELLPQDSPQYAGVMGQYAQAMFFANGTKMSDEIRQQIDKTLAVEPLEMTALGLLGIDAFEREEYRQAIDYWRQAIQNAEGEAVNSLKAGMKRAAERLAQAGEPVPDMPELEEVKLRVVISVDPTLAEEFSVDQTVFVFARPVGGRMPLAAIKLKLSDLPTEVVLDDSLAMSPQAKLSMSETVEITARVSRSGEPKPEEGDLFGTISPVTVKTTDTLTLKIDQVVQQ